MPRSARRQPLNPFNPAYENTAGYRDCLLALLMPLSAASKSVTSDVGFRSEGGRDEWNQFVSGARRENTVVNRISIELQ